jgi:hypothetical protein
MEFESVAEAHRYLSNQVAECAYRSMMALVGAPSPVAPRDLIAELAQDLETITETLHTLALLEPGSRKVALALARAPLLTEALHRAGADGSPMATLEEPLADFFAAFDVRPTFLQMLQEARARAATSRA